jgi:hypothetical protein
MDDVGERMRRSRFFAPSKWLVLQSERRSKRSPIGEVIIELIMVSDKVWALIINLDSTSAIGRSPATAMPDFPLGPMLFFLVQVIRWQAHCRRSSPASESSTILSR